MNFEGILIQHISYRERDLIAKVLLRDGLMGSFFIYGGQGGGKAQKPKLYEPGYMLKMMVNEKRKKEESGELLIVKEASRTWSPEHIRYDIKAFYLMCLYFEIIQKVALPLEKSSDNEDVNEYEGLFSVLSNGLYYLEDSLKLKKFVTHQHLHLFLVKLIYHLGIMPDTDHCCFCQTELNHKPNIIFISSVGQFSCSDCSQGESDKRLWLNIRKASQTKYQYYSEIEGTNFRDCSRLVEFFCHQFHLNLIELKSYSLLF